MQENNRTEISTLGEFGLIKRLTEGIELKNDSTKYGVGDDCAVLSYPDKDILVTTDLLMEGVHFDLTYTPLKHLGYKSVMVNLSDVYAMYGMPKQIVVSMALSKKFSIEDMEEFYAGLRLACDEHGVDIVGGDTSSSYTGLAISITCIGEVEKDGAVFRNGAKPTDLICVSGDLGAAYMGLQLLEREKHVFDEQLAEAGKLKGEARKRMEEQILQNQPDFAGREYLLQRQLRPEARRDIILKLREMGIRPTAMIEERIPLDYQTAAMAEELNMNVTTCALNGGEDYELLFTVPISEHERIEEMENVKIIGHITEQELGCALVTRDNQEFELKAQGWNPLK